MGQAQSTGQYLVNHDKKEIVRQDEFMDKNIYEKIKKVNERYGWTLDDDVEYMDIDRDAEVFEYIESLILVQNYTADKKDFPNHWFTTKKE